jgi:hypothetical protein
MEEDYMGSQGTERTIALEEEEGRSRKRGRGGKGRSRIRRKKNNNNTKKTALLLQAFYTYCLNMLTVLIQTRRIKKQ